MKNKHPHAAVVLVLGLAMAGLHLADLLLWSEADTGFAAAGSGFDVPGHELKNIVFRDIRIGSERESRKQTLSLQCCENITFERLQCI